MFRELNSIGTWNGHILYMPDADVRTLIISLIRVKSIIFSHSNT
jgi:hypothetical protein